MSDRTTIFEKMSGLARQHGAVNLGQGFPETDGAPELRALAARYLIEGPNQYPPMAGVPELRAAVAAHYNRHQGLDLTADEVIVTSGATEALAAALLALLGPGDEAVLFEPLYDSYLPIIHKAGAVPRVVRLAPPDWRVDPAALDAALSPATRVILLNTPLNPTASLFPPETLALIADRAVRHDATVIADEVWEHVTFDGHRHASALSAPGLRDRCVKIGSAGKIFALTGWKIGWAVAAPALARRVAGMHQYLTFTTVPALQRAVAEGLGWPDAYFDRMRADLTRSRDRLDAALRAEGFSTLPCAGTYFLSVDLPGSGITLGDRAFALAAVAEHGVATIPVSAFAADPAEAEAEAGAGTVVRLCFAKSDATLDEGAARLGRARRALG